MRRRTLLRLGLAGTAIVAVIGGGIAIVRPGLDGSTLSPPARQIFRAVALAVLDTMLPTPPDDAIASLLQRLDVTISGLPPPARIELSQLLAVLATVGGRRMLTGVDVDWAEASIAQVQRGLRTMRDSSFDLPQQAYHALRDLTNAAYFADPSTWSRIGYPGPVAL